MSYYMGDYYRGDPGIGSFFAGLARKAVGFIPGVGPAISTALDVLKPAGGISAAAKSSIMKAGGAVSAITAKHPVLTAAGVAGAGMAMGAGAEHLIASAGAACPKGFHPCKSKHGCKRGACVRNRHMNVCNPRALRRSIRRARGFTKLAMRVIHITHPKKKGRFGGFKTKKR